MLLRRKSVLMGAVVGAWLVAAGVSVAALLAFDLRPGPQAAAPQSAGFLPESVRSRLQLDPHRPTLVTFLHSQCPCSRATVRELTGLINRVPDRMAVRVVVVTPDDQQGTKFESDLQLLARLPGVEILYDAGDDTVDAAGAMTSGLCLLYGVDGTLLFEGGITPSRGHEGHSKGKAAIERILADEGPEVRRSEVYGCLLKSPTELPLPTESQEGGVSCRTAN